MNLKVLELGYIAITVFQVATVLYFWSTAKMLKAMSLQNDFIIEEINNLRIDDIEQLYEQIEEMKDQLTFLKAASFFQNRTAEFLEPAELNPRSAAAKEMWKRRKAKKLEKKE